jgi:prepilin-type N-terminal cleavage/methylation domain-containing protein
MRGLNMIRQTAPRMRNAAFTLIELLVVMAITVILLGLVFGPLVQGFNLTNRARVQIETQDAARRISEIGQRDLSQATFIFDNSQQSINFWVRQPDANGNPNGQPAPQALSFAFADIVAPARVLDQDPNPDPALIDPTTGVVGNRGNIAIPVAPGRVIIRYFVGLRDNASQADGTFGTSGMPVRPYMNYYDRPTTSQIANHNPFVLYRAVIAPFTSTGAVDTRFFEVDGAGNPILFEPNFFYSVRPAVKPNDNNIASAAYIGWRDDNGDGQVNLCENWKALARAIVPTDRADEAVVQYDDDGKPIYFTDPLTNRLAMNINPLVKFQPTYIGNDSGAPSSNKDPSSGASSVIPSTHRETYGHWTAPFRVYVYHSGLAGPLLNYYFWDGTVDSILDFTFNTANNTSSSTAVPFFPSRFNPLRERIDVNNPPLDRANPPAIMFTVDPRRGVVNFAFPDWIWLYWDSASPADNALAGDPHPSTWHNGENGKPQQVEGINTRFDVYVASNGLGNGMRYIDLQELPDGRTSPLQRIPNCIMVPGSETVTGPDMRPGPHYGKTIKYTRVDRHDAVLGPNEYFVQLRNHADFYRADYVNRDPMEQARLRKGIIRFDSQPDDGTKFHKLPTVDADGNPAAPIVVRYQIQNNLDELSDTALQTVKADYLTRQLMSFTLGVRLYDLRSGQPQQVTLSQKITVRNLQR